ncbi:hypothetical protein ACH5RR_008750 [Cinchona calisaya]|uniref:DUF4408 domain-containing protein n=1 Tax=Cinchona calisaya TaxID=153742 RepID=A0ABD3AHP6_9GENT
MAALLIESLSNNKTSFQIAVRAIELLLLSAGLVSTFLTFKGAVTPYSYDLNLSNFMKPLPYFKSWFSSTFCICIIMNFVVILIAVSSHFHHPKMDNNDTDIEDCGDGEGYDLHSDLSPSSLPPPAPPLMQNSRQKHLQDTEPKDRNSVEKVDESFQEVFCVLCGLTEAKEIKKSNIAMASLKNQQDIIAMDSNIGIDDQVVKSFQAVFSDFHKFKDAKEIKKSHSLEPSSQVITNQKGTKTRSTKNEQQNQIEQTNKQLKREEDEEEDDTMEATWRAIKEGGAKPQKKQLKKSETWAHPQTVVAAPQANINTDLEEDIPSSAATWKELRKSMTFNETVSVSFRGGLRRDPSTNLEEFNQRVEAFIKKFNNEMRLQRQESEQRYLDMISRGL